MRYADAEIQWASIGSKEFKRHVYSFYYYYYIIIIIAFIIILLLELQTTIVMMTVYND